MSFFHLLVRSGAVQNASDSLKTKFMGDVQSFFSMPFDEQFHTVSGWAVDFGVKLLVCLIALWLGKKAIRFACRFLKKVMNRRKVDPSVSHFLTNLLRAAFWVIFVWFLIDYIGADTSSFIALFASAGLAFGLALSGTLQNFAGGVMILLFKPFRIGDYIEAQGQGGTVVDITIINTVITTPDNKTIYLPNGATSTGVVNNYSQQHARRVEWTFGIGYGEDYDKAKELLAGMLGTDSRILPDPAPFIAVSELGQGSVDILVRAWVASDDFWPVFFDLNELIYKIFPINGLSLSSPQMDVYLHRGDARPEYPRGGSI